MLSCCLICCLAVLLLFSSCLFIPDAVGVGSSGALMGLLGAWCVWICIRWNRIPPECRNQRNCQLFTVVAAVVVTLATSFMPGVDFAAHGGGAFQGVLWGIAILGHEMENENKVRRFLWLLFVLITSCCDLDFLFRWL
jgi:membrane associated rhomboid family serine protease